MGDGYDRSEERPRHTCATENGCKACAAMQGRWKQAEDERTDAALQKAFDDGRRSLAKEVRPVLEEFLNYLDDGSPCDICGNDCEDEGHEPGTHCDNIRLLHAGLPGQKAD